MINKNIFKNTVMLYIMTFAKLILPLFTFPYLTRVLSVSAYGQLTYVRSCVTYIQLIIDFGFLLSATKDIVLHKDDNSAISKICSNVLSARIYLSIICFFVYLGMCYTNNVLSQNIFFSIFSIVPILLTVFLFDFLFRGLEIMHIITVRYVLMKLFSTLLVFVFVKNDSQLIVIPILDIISSFVAVVLTLKYIKNKLNIKLYIAKFREAILCLKQSFIFFLSDIATTGFGVLNTLLIGVFLTTEDIAIWGVAYTLISAVQNLYSPISNGIYPQMVQNKSYQLLKKITCILVPIVVLGCLFCTFFAKYIVIIIGGIKYDQSIFIFQLLIPVLLFSFLAIIIGWPGLGAINKQKSLTYTTIITSLIHIIGLIFLGITRNFNLINIAIMRSVTEFFLFFFRFLLLKHFRNEFID